MKQLAIQSTVLLFALSSFALDVTNSWSDIFSNKNAYYSTEYPIINRIGLNNVCMSGATIQSIQPIEVCGSYETEFVPDSDSSNTGHWYMKCTQTGMKKVTVDREYDKQVCTNYKEVHDGESVRYECTSRTTLKSAMPSVIEVTVWEEDESRESSTWPGFTKLYSIPNCN